MDGYQSVVLVKPEVFVYQIPPRQTNRGYRAADWGLDKSMWQGRLRIMAQGKNVSVRLEDKTSGELFAQANVTSFPTDAIEAVNDSSRYFVLRITDDTGRNAYVGMGFQERNDAFDFNAALIDHYRWEKEEEKLRLEANKPKKAGPSTDYSMKEGQTIKINFGKKTQSGETGQPQRNAPSVQSDFAGVSLLPPPPSGGSRRTRGSIPSNKQASPMGNSDLLGGRPTQQPQQPPKSQNTWDEWM